MATVRTEVPAATSVLLSLGRAPLQCVALWPEAKPTLGAAAALFVHYDPAGAVSSEVLSALDALRDAGLAVLFVSNAGRLTPAAWDALRPRCAGILVRRNVGYDFGAWREGLHAWRTPLAGVRLLLLMNDSVLGPFAPLRPVLDRIDFDRADVWGAVDSEQRLPHLQSWFVAAGRRALDHPAWDSFWSGVRPVRSKIWVVRRYEVGLSRALRDAGLRLASLWPYAALIEAALASPPETLHGHERLQAERVRYMLAERATLNPSADLWRPLLRAGCPFIKRELVTRNPAGVRDVDDWQAEVRRLFG